MNAPVLMAQLSGSTQAGSTPPKTVRVEKPQNGQAITVQLDGQTRVDFSAIASERITFVRVGNKLIVLFDNESTVTVDPVFDSAGNALPTVDFAMSSDRTLTGTEFAAAFPITTDQSVLPAAGNAGGGPTGGANFRSATVNGLGDPNAPLDLLGNENSGASSFLVQDAGANPVPFVINAVLNSTIIETTLSDSSNGFVTQTTGSVSLAINWNGQPAGIVTFATDTVANMTALGLSSNGVALVYSLSADGTALSAFAGTGGPLVFTVVLSGSGNGSYTFTLSDNLDHLGANGAALPLAFNVVATDAEGDTVDQQFTVVVTDDVPTVGAVGAHTLSESTASGGESNAFVTTSTGAVSLNIDWNSDDSNAGINGIDRSVAFATGTEAAFAGLGLTSNGQSITYTMNGDRTLLTASVGERVIFTVSLSDVGNGSYTFTLSDNIDHRGANGATLPLTFNVTVHDADGDAVNQQFTVNVADDVPTVGSVGPHTLSESTAGGSEQPPFEQGPFESFSEDSNAFVEVSTGAVSLNIDWNSDDSNAGINGIDRSVAFAAGTEAAFAGLGLTSNGQTITYTINGDRTLLTASVGERAIFTVSLSDAGNGSYTFTLSDNIDHRGENSSSLPLTFNVVATDADGDPVNQQFVVNVLDDAPTAGPVGDRTLSESTDSGASNAFIQVSTGTVSLNIDWNSDDSNAGINGIDRSVAFAAGTEAAFAALGLTSNGQTITYTMNGDRTQLTASVGERVVFTVSLSDTDHGSYTFTLSDNIDHLGQNGATLPLTFNVVATDADGDPVDQHFVVNITDDVPQPVGKITTGVVGEDGLTPSNQNGGSFDGVNNASTGAVSLGIDWNSDDDVRGPGDNFGRTLAFLVGQTPVTAGSGSVSGITVVDGQSGAELTSGGVALRYVVTSDATGGQLLTAYRGESNVQIFTLALDATASNGSYTFTLLGPLDHAGNSNSISLTFDIRATDSDNDFIDREFVVTVDDDTPVVGAAARGTVEEEEFAVAGAGIEDTDGAGDDDLVVGGFPILNPTTRTAQGTLAISWGADGGNSEVNGGASAGNGDRAVTFGAGLSGATRTLTAAEADAFITVAGGLTASGLTSRGDALSYVLSNDGGTLTAVAGGRTVFTVVLSDTGSGSYTFTLYDTLEHPAGNGANGEDVLSLTFGVTARDADGDTAPTSFAVDVIDDVPVAIGTILTRYVEEEELSGGNEDLVPGVLLPDGDVAGITTITTTQAGGPLNILWGGDDSNRVVNGGFNGTQVAGDRSVVFDVAAPAGADRTLTAAEVNAFVGVTGGVGGLTAGGLTSEGVGLVYTLSANNTVLTARAGAGGPVVFTVTLSDADAGSYTFNLAGVLDHPVHASGAANEDVLTFTFRFAARDGDGDVARNNFAVTVIDDAPITTGTIATQVVDEDGLPGGLTNSYPGDVAGSAVLAGGSLNISWGADNGDTGTDTTANGGHTLIQDAIGGNGNRSVVFTAATLTALDAMNLSSNGQTVHYITNADGTLLVAYRGATVASIGDVNPSNLVFRVSLSDEANGSYSFELLRTLDHPMANSEDDIHLNFGFQATDSDGDTVGGTFRVTVNDDAPAVGAAARGTVEEEEFAVAGAGIEDTDGAGDDDLVVGGFPVLNPTTRTAQGTLAISWGADGGNSEVNGGASAGNGDRAVTFGAGLSGATRTLTAAEADAFITVAGGLTASGLTSRGDALSYVLSNDGGTLTAVAGGRTVFTVVLSDTGSGSYTFTLYDTLEHPAGNGANGEDVLSLTFGVTARDADGDTAPTSFAVDVIDDVPVAIGTILTRYVEEEELSGGNEDLVPGVLLPDGDVAGITTITTTQAGGPLNILWGGDDSNRVVNGGFNGTQVAGDRSVVFDVASPAGTDRVLTAAEVNAFVGVTGGIGGLTAGGLTSEGVGLVYTLSANNTVLTARAGAGGPVVFTVTLSDADAGSYTFNLTGVLDHPVHASGAANEDVLTFTFRFAARDGDGDIARNNFAVAVIDDAPIIGAVEIGAVIEEAILLPLSNGSFEADVMSAGGSVISDVRGNYAFINPQGWTVSGFAGVYAPAASIISPSGHAGSNVVFLDNGATLTRNTGVLLDTGSSYEITFNVGDRTDQNFGGGLVRLVTVNGDVLATLALPVPADGQWASVTLNTGPINAALNGQELRVEIVHGGSGQVLVDNVQLYVTPFDPQNTDSGSLAIGWGADGIGSVAFNPALVGDSGLNSHGEDIFYSLNPNGTVLTAATASGRVIFTVALDPNGSGTWTYTQRDAIDHPPGSAPVSLGLGFIVTDGDGDTAMSTISIRVDDDTPVLVGSVTTGLTLDEDDLANGTDHTGPTRVNGNLNVDFGMDGGTIALSAANAAWNPATNTLSANDGAWRVVLNGDGTYTFFLERNTLAHGPGNNGQNNLAITVNYAATDYDQDPLNGSFTINIVDDVPTIVGNPTVGAVDETNTPLAQSTFGSLNVNIGADKVGASLAFATDGNGLPLHPAGLQSDGVPLNYVLRTTEYGEKQLVAFKQGETADNPVFIVALSSPANPTYIFTLFQNLDHPNGSDPLDLNFTIRVTDGDGDFLDRTVTVTVADSVPTIPATTEQVTGVQDDALFGGNPEPGDTKTASGTLSYNFGADEHGHLSWLNPTLPATGGYSSLITGNTLDIFQLQNNVNVKVFTVTLDPATGAYTVTQTAAIRHPNGNGETGESFNLNYRVTDGDNDYVDSHLKVTVGDDMPILVGSAGAVSVNETNTPLAQSAFGSLNVKIGADKAGASLAFATDDNNLPLHPAGLQSDGTPLEYALRTTEYGEKQLVAFKQGESVDNPVFIVALSSPANPTYIFTLFQNLDHASGSDPLNLNFTIRVTDGDGDFVDRTVSVTVADSVPTIPATTEQVTGVQDDALSGGIPEPGDTMTASGVLSHNFGADEHGHLSWLNPTLPATGGYSSLITGNTLDIFQLQNNVNVKVFTVTLDPATGAYTVTQIAAVRHPSGNGETGESFDLNYRVTDGDNDYVDSHLKVTVGDDVPLIVGAATQVNLLTNGDFTGGSFPHTESWGQWATDGTGWKISGTVPGQANVQLERIASGYLSVVTSNGKPMVDLAATPGDVEISQTINGLSAGQHYTLSFEIGASDPSSAGLEVYWNGNLIQTYHPGSTMAVQTLDLTAIAGANTVTFKEIGSFDNTGTYLANVSLVQAAGASLPVFHANIGEDGASVVTLVNGVDFKFGADGPGAVAFDTAHATMSTPTGTTLGMPTLSYDPVTGKLTVDPGWGFGGLSQGEIATLSVPFTVTDADGDTKTGIYQFTITGSNDPVSTSEGFPETGTITEYAENDPRAGSNTDRTEFDAPPGYAGYNGGGFWIYDDQGDTHTVTVTPPAGAIGYVTATVGEETVNDGAGFVNWQYHVTDAQLNFLSAGETVNQVFRITVSDGHGSSTYRDITVKLVGTEDAPQITVGQSDSTYSFLEETNSGLTTNGTLTVSDVDHLDTVHATVLSVTASGSGIENLYTNAFLKGLLSVSPDPVLDANGPRSAALTWTFNSGNEAFNFLPAGWESVLNYTIQVSDGHGGFDTQVVQIKLHGTNDAPVISGAVATTVFEAGGLNSVVTADVASDNRFEPVRNVDSVAAHAIDANVDTAADMKNVVLAVQTALGTGATFADAIAQVWDYLDDNYQYYNTPVNQASVLLALVYADYLEHGGRPLLDVIVKYTPDGNDAGNVADRVQSLHDNLLGAVDTPSIEDKFSADPVLLANLKAQIAAAHLTDRPIYSGNEGAPNNALAWDLDHGLLHAASGQLTATDAENDALTWSITNASLYGAMSIDQTGKWTYVLDNGLAATQALKEGQVVTETFTASVTDGHGGTTTQTVTVTIVGTNDAPVLSADGASVSETSAVNAGTPILFPGQSVLTNDTDVDSPTLTVISIRAANPIGQGAQEPPITLVGGVAVAHGTYGNLTMHADGTYTYTPNAAFDALAQGQVVTDVFKYGVTDDHGASAASFLTLTITGGNDAPVLDLSGPSVAGNDVTTTTVEQLPQWFMNAATITDIDSGTMASLRVTLTALDGPAEVLSLNTAALNAVAANPTLSWSFNSATGVLLVTGVAATSVYQTILDGVVYTNNSDNPTTTDRTIHVVVNDGITDSAQQTATLHVWASNDPPVLAGTLQATVAEGGTHVILPTELGFTDPDDVASGVTFIVSNQVNGIVRLDGVPSLSFTGQQLADGRVTFVHNGSDTTSATFDVKVEDGNEDGSTPTSQTFHFNVTPVNDAPVIDSHSGADLVSLSIAENTTAVTTVHATDSDGPSLTYTISGGADAALFQVNSATGALSFINAPNFESPLDAGQDNHYNVIVRASDGTLFDTQAFDITVTDVNEFSAVNDTIQVLHTNASPFTLPTAALLWNDSGFDGVGVSMVSVGSPASLSGDLINFQITGPTGSSGSFSYTITDGVVQGTGTAGATRVAAFTSTSGNDILIVADSGSWTVAGGGGNDVVVGAASSSNTLYGDSSSGIESFSDGNDLIIGGSNATNTMYGGGGNDLLIAGTSSTTVMYGGSGNDVFRVADNSTSNAYGGSGTDILDFSNLNSAIDFTLAQPAPGVTTTFSAGNMSGAYDSIEGVVGTRFGDTLRGSSLSDIINGGAGNDTLWGMGGNDIFRFTEAGAANRDTIMDYAASGGVGDRLDLSALLDVNFGAGSVQGDFVRLQASGSNILVQVDTNGPAGGANWADVAVLQNYNTTGNQVLVEFENQVRTLTV